MPPLHAAPAASAVHHHKLTLHMCSPWNLHSLSSLMSSPFHVPAGGVIHVKHLDDRTLPMQLTEIVHPGYERRLPGEVGAGCRCRLVQGVAALGPGCFGRHCMGPCG